MVGTVKTETYGAAKVKIHGKESTTNFGTALGASARPWLICPTATTKRVSDEMIRRLYAKTDFNLT